jgi:hypothetical protein
MVKLSIATFFLSLLTLSVIFMACGEPQNQLKVEFGQEWEIHDMDRPLPEVVEPGDLEPIKRPEDALVLFDGKDISQWKMVYEEKSIWKVENGYMEALPETGPIMTREGFGECQLHIEWATPEKIEGEGQGRGNSGVFLMGMYEVQVLDSYENETYADGQAAAIYGQYPPLVNASRPPGEWQSYDITWHGPRFDETGKLLSAARITMLHNGILVHDNVTLTGPTGHHARPSYKAHPDKLTIGLQDHGNPVRFRNIWIQKL